MPRDLSKVKEVILKDAIVRGRYSTNEGECVIGGLMKAAGIRLPTQDEVINGKFYISRNEVCIINSTFENEIKKREEIYSLSKFDLLELQYCNDNYYDLEERRVNLIRKVEEMEKK